MNPVNLLQAKSRDELREWLEANHRTQPECWVVVKRGCPKDDETFWYIDAVEEALCFGWIDSITKKLEDGQTWQRLAPRKPKSLWSELNKERCRRMEKLGKMTDAGRATFPDMSEDGFIMFSEVESALKEEEEVWRNFQQFPPLYQRVRVDTIQIMKPRDEAVFQSRLQKLIDNIRQNKMFGEWNDGGRLLGY